MAQSICTDEDFVRAWQAGASANDVAKALGLSRWTAIGRAYRLRKRGVPLKRMPGSGGSNKKDSAEIARLCKLAESLAPNGKH